MRIDSVQQYFPGMMYRDPPPISVGILIVEPDKRASGRTPNKDIAFQRRRCGDSSSEPRQPTTGSWGRPSRGEMTFVRVRHPRRRPNQIAAQRHQPAPVFRIEALQQRIAAPARLVGLGTIGGGLAAGPPGAHVRQLGTAAAHGALTAAS
jgi:hypothetical protein